MANPSCFQITPRVDIVENNEINFPKLYLHRTTHGPKQNQLIIIEANARDTRRGETAVNNWPVYDGPGQDATVVARAQGLNIYAGNGNRHNTFSLVFEVNRFKGSTLQVMGVSVEDEKGEWAIVGGTGEFTMATGVISKKRHKQKNDGDIIELAIRALCPLPKGSRSLLTKIGPWGGNGGTAQDITEAPRRLESITVYSVEKKVVNSIKFSYIDHTGKKRTAGPFGGSSGESHTITLASSEFVKEVSGTFGKYEGSTVITSLKFVNNDNKTRGHFGDRSGEGTQFSVPVQDSSVVGFFGRGKDFLHAVGVYVHPF